MMIVVQLLAADEEAPRREVRRHVGRFEVAIAPPVAETVDDAGRQNGIQIICSAEIATPWMPNSAMLMMNIRSGPNIRAAVQVSLEPVGRCADAVLVHRRLVVRGDAIQIHALQHHGLDAEHLRAMRIFLGLALGVVLAMDRDPFLGHHAGRNPRPETEEVGERRMEIDAAVRLAAMQVQGHGKNRQLRDDQEVHAFCQPRGMAEAVIEEIENLVEHDVGIPQEGKRISHYTGATCTLPVTQLAVHM